MNMGLGGLGSPNLVFKRKFRWTFEVTTSTNDIIPAYFVKMANRPTIEIGETEINFLNAKMFIPGKATWNTIEVTYYDIGNGGPGISALYNWLATVYNFTNPTILSQSSKSSGPGGYGATGILNMYDGCGTPMETWTLNHMWPTNINFGELDYASSDEATIALTLRYSEANYVTLCGGGQIKPACAGCPPA
jgi:T4-like virus tail tube protein gp19